MDGALTAKAFYICRSGAYAILSEKMKFHALAVFYKVRDKYATVYGYRHGFPGIFEVEQKLYDQIKFDQSVTKKTN